MKAIIHYAKPKWVESEGQKRQIYTEVVYGVGIAIHSKEDSVLELSDGTSLVLKSKDVSSIVVKEG